MKRLPESVADIDNELSKFLLSRVEFGDHLVVKPVPLGFFGMLYASSQGKARTSYDTNAMCLLIQDMGLTAASVTPLAC